MKLRDTLIPYITVGAIIAGLMLLFFGDNRARTFIVTNTIGYGAVMVYLAGTQ